MESRKLHQYFLSELKLQYEPHEASVICNMLFEDLLGINKRDIITHPNRIIEPEGVRKMEEALASLKQHKPVQYVIGQAWFYNLHFIVSPAVLIPRPETEELVSLVIDFLKTSPENSLLDIGTGSGCIPISIKKNSPHTFVSAIDISEEALQIAGENAKTHGTEINFKRIDFLNRSEWEQLPQYNVIVSNPPYIPYEEKEKLDKNVRDFEPHLALFVPNNNPLLFYEGIVAFAEEHLLAAGIIFMETHESLASNVAALFELHGYKATIKKDLFQKERMVVATRCH
jgi:release factor glutamine methyltransferase